MKILQVNCVYGVGSTGKIVLMIHEELLVRGMKSVVCYGRGAKCRDDGIYKTCGELYAKANHLTARLRGQLYGGCYGSTQRLISIIKREKPDVVHLQCINGFFVNIPRLLKWLKGNAVRTVITLHAEFMFTANCGHARNCQRWKSGCEHCPQLKTDLNSFGVDGTRSSWKKMRAAFQGFERELTIVSVSPWLMQRALQSPFLQDKRHCVIMNGLNTEIFFPRPTEALRSQYGSGARIVLYVTRYLTDSSDDLKGGRYAIELAKKLDSRGIVIVVAGRFDENLTLPANMTAIGPIEDQSLLAQYYSMADATLLTSERETFSMVTAESLCCGTPVAGFEAGGPESIALPEFSRFVPYGDTDALGEALLGIMSQGTDRNRLAKEAKELYSGRRMAEEYINLYKEMAEG